MGGFRPPRRRRPSRDRSQPLKLARRLTVLRFACVAGATLVREAKERLPTPRTSPRWAVEPGTFIRFGVVPTCLHSDEGGRTGLAGTQVPSVWRIRTVPGSEKLRGRHPTQKLLRLVRRSPLASTREGDLVFHPYCGSVTTAAAAEELVASSGGGDGWLSSTPLGRRVEAARRTDGRLYAPLDGKPTGP